jgi:hypothetical protein
MKICFGLNWETANELGVNDGTTDGKRSGPRGVSSVAGFGVPNIPY